MISGKKQIKKIIIINILNINKRSYGNRKSILYNHCSFLICYGSIVLNHLKMHGNSYNGKASRRNNAPNIHINNFWFASRYAIIPH